MLQIKLKSKGDASTEGGVGAKASAGGEATTIACPDHLNIADLVVAKSIGSVTASHRVKTLGRKSRPELGERVHICVRCDLPIAIYGRLSPCDHAFCLDCVRSDSTCPLCNEPIQKIQTLKVNEGIWICGAPQCLKSFLKKDELDSHVRRNHGDLRISGPGKGGGNESEVASARKVASDSTVQALAKSALSRGSSSRQKTQHAGVQPKLEAPFFEHVPNLVSGMLPNNRNPQGFDGLDARNQYLQENVDLQGKHRQEFGQFQNSQLGVMSKNPIADNVIQLHPPPTFVRPLNPNLVQIPPQFNSQFGQDGIPFYGFPFHQRQDSARDGEQQQSSVLGFPPRPVEESVNFLGKNYPQPWSGGPTGAIFDPSLVDREHVDAFKNLSMTDSHERAAVFQGNFKQNQPLNLPPHHAANKNVEHLSGQNAIETRNLMGMLPPPPPPPSHPPFSSQLNRGHYPTGGASHDAQPPGWRREHQDKSGGA